MPIETVSSWYRLLDSPAVEQRELLFDVPLLTATYDEQKKPMIEVEPIDLIVLTQSCDLQHGKVARILMAPTTALTDWLKENPFDLNHLEDIRQGFDNSLYLLPAWSALPGFLDQDRIVDFGSLQTVGTAEVEAFLEKADTRVSLASPAREHFSQAVARSFMRVGLPIDVPSFKLERVSKKTQELTSLPFENNEDLIGPSSYILARHYAASIQQQRRVATDEIFYRLSIVQNDREVIGVGYTEEDARQSLARQLLRRCLQAREGDERWTWTKDALSPPFI